MKIGQIMALIALVAPTEKEEFAGQSFALMYAVFPCKVKSKTNRVNLPFPLLQYDTTRYGNLNMVVDFVDSITIPAMIHPVSMNPDDYFNKNEELRKHIEFVSIPYRFLFRDGWEDIDTVEENMELLEIDSVVENKGLIKNIIQSTVQGK